MISIIIPVYNVEKYLDQCLESVLNQSHADFECILVNDGSTDNSGNICDKWAKKEPRIKVFHQENQGVSATRNYGIDKSQGEYIVFVDSDDWVDIDYLETLMEEDSDLVISGDLIETLDGPIKKNIPDEKRQIPISSKYLNEFSQLVESHLLFGPVFKRYKTSIIKNNQIYFNKDLSCGEDLVFNFEYLKHVTNIYTIPKATYHYRRFESNTLSTIFRPDFWDINYQQWLLMKEFFQSKNIFQSPLTDIMYNRLWGIIYDSIFNINYKDIGFLEIVKYIKRIISICEISSNDFILANFETSNKIKYLISNRHYIILALKLKFRL